VGIDVEEDLIVTDFGNKNYIYPRQPLETSFTGKNIVVISLDSWNYRSFDSIAAPHIYQFAQKSSQFTRHYSGSNGTRTGVFSIFYGLPGVYWGDFCEKEIAPVLFVEAEKNKYEVTLFPSASLRNPALDKSVFVTVADQCAASKGVNAWQRDRNLTDNFVRFLKNRKDKTKPFFSFLFYDSLHSMILPEGYKGPFPTTWTYPKYEQLGKDVDPTEFYNLYRNMLRYLDGLIGEVMQAMEAEGLLDNTIIVITSDHGQEFNDNKKGFWGHNGNYSDAQIHVPLIYYLPGKAPNTYSHWTSHYDIVPTLMQDAFETKNPTGDYSIGKPLFDEHKRDFLMVDSYIGFGIIDTLGVITNIGYDGNYEITDKHLNELHQIGINPVLYQKVMDQIATFYTK
jgi:membrane-anchored protein YejM (alkaline phosphatase superfamily)